VDRRCRAIVQRAAFGGGAASKNEAYSRLQIPTGNRFQSYGAPGDLDKEVFVWCIVANREKDMVLTDKESPDADNTADREEGKKRKAKKV
jgi:hypothetical protein